MLIVNFQLEFFCLAWREAATELLFFWGPCMHIYQSSSRVALWKHRTVHTRMKKDVNSINMAPVSIRPACLRIAGIARLPMADAPVRNFAALIHPPPSLLVKKCVDPSPKNRHGIGIRTYMRAANIGHQLLYKAHASICSRMLVENINASPASTSTVIAIVVGEEEELRLSSPLSLSPLVFVTTADFSFCSVETDKRVLLKVEGPPVRVLQIPPSLFCLLWALAAVRPGQGRVPSDHFVLAAAAAEGEEMMRLTVEQAAREAGSDGSGAKALNLSHRALSDVSCLRSFNKLERLDLGYNCLVTLEGLSSCANLKWLSVIENKLVSLKGVEGLSKLQVLNAGKNKLTKMDEVASLTSLGALILNDNNISSICKLDWLQQLNTLVLSKNPVFTIGNALAKAKSMKKLSLSHCQIEHVGSSLAACVELKELRLSHNKITTIPSDLAKNVKILNLDLGNNLIERSSDLKVLSELRYLRNLNLQGNPISEKDSLVKKVKKFVPTLRILNGKPLEPSSKSDKSSGKDNIPSKYDPVEIDRKKDKRQQSKQHLNGPEEPEVKTISPGVTTSALGKSEVLDGKERKRDRKEAKKSVEEPTNDGKSKRKDDVDHTGRKDKKDAKRKKFVDEEDAEVIDNTDISFADLVFSKQNNSEPKLKDSSAQEVAPDGKFGELVIDHTKKKNKSKGAVTITDSSVLKMISSVPEVGSGGLGLSGWDD